MKKTRLLTLLLVAGSCFLNAQEAAKLPVFKGLTHAWSFTEDSDGKITDAAATETRPGIGLTVTGEPEIVDGIFGKAAKLSGGGDFFSFPKELTFELKDRYTIVMIVRFDKKQSAPLFATGKDHVRYYRIVAFSEEEDKIAAFASVGGQDKQQGETKDAELKVGEWNSIVISGMRHSGHLKIDLFVNGVKIMDKVFVRSPGSIGDDIRFGVIGAEAGRNPDTLAATFDEIQIYNTTLGDREVKKIQETLTGAK